MTTALGFLVVLALAMRAWGSMATARQLRRIADAMERR